MEFSNFIWYYITYNVVMRRNSLFKIDTTRDYDILIITRTIFVLGGVSTLLVLLPYLYATLRLLAQLYFSTLRVSTESD